MLMYAVRCGCNAQHPHRSAVNFVFQVFWVEMVSRPGFPAACQLGTSAFLQARGVWRIRERRRGAQ